MSGGNILTSITIILRSIMNGLVIEVSRGPLWCCDSCSLSSHILYWYVCQTDVEQMITFRLAWVELLTHYSDLIMSMMAYQITSVSSVYSTLGLGTDQRKHQRSPLLAFVRGIHQWSMNSAHKRPLTQTMFPFDDIIMNRPTLDCGVI